MRFQRMFTCHLFFSLFFISFFQFGVLCRLNIQTYTSWQILDCKTFRLKPIFYAMRLFDFWCLPLVRYPVNFNCLYAKSAILCCTLADFLLIFFLRYIFCRGKNKEKTNITHAMKGVIEFNSRSYDAMRMVKRIKQRSINIMTTSFNIQFEFKIRILCKRFQY